MYAKPIVMATLLLLPLDAGRVLAQEADPCAAGHAAAFDHMLGEWFGVQYAYPDGDTTRVATTELVVREVLGGCAHEERLDVHMADGEHLFAAIALRSYDAGKGRWRFTEVDDGGGHFTLEGRADDGQWRFYADRERDGRAYILRLSYPRISEDRFHQIFERSYDGGTTWERWTHIDFLRDR